LQYTELGGKTDDYSSSVEQGERNRLQYTDYMKAHTTNRLVDPRVMKERKSYKNIEDYESARAEAVTRAQTDEERRWAHERLEQQEKLEYERLNRLKKRDDLVDKHFQRVNGLLLR
jgi:beta-N-acetylglucosaminidase